MPELARQGGNVTFAGFRHPYNFERLPAKLTEVLPNLLGAKGADAIEPEAEDETVFLP